MITSYRELDDRQMDVLCELGNIGAGNAATALSELIDDAVYIGMPRVMALGYDDVVRMAGNPEEPAVAVMVRFEGDMRGVILFVVGLEDAKEMAGMLTKGLPEDEAAEDQDTVSDLKLSAIREIGNIVGSSYLGSTGALTGFKISASAPYVSVDMIGAVLSATMSEFSVGSNKILLVEGDFFAKTRRLDSHVILFADIPSLNRMMAKLGIEG